MKDSVKERLTGITKHTTLEPLQKSLDRAKKELSELENKKSYYDNSDDDCSYEEEKGVVLLDLDECEELNYCAPVETLRLEMKEEEIFPTKSKTMSSKTLSIQRESLSQKSSISKEKKSAESPQKPQTIQPISLPSSTKISEEPILSISSKQSETESKKEISSKQIEFEGEIEISSKESKPESKKEISIQSVFVSESRRRSYDMEDQKICLEEDENDECEEDIYYYRRPNESKEELEKQLKEKREQVSELEKKIQGIKNVVRVFSHSQSKQKTVRDDFSTTLFWLGGERTTLEKKSTHSFSLCDSITSFRIVSFITLK